MGHVHPDLVRAAGQERQFHEAVALDALFPVPGLEVRAQVRHVPALQDFVERHARIAVFPHRAAGFVVRILVDGEVDAAFRSFEQAVDQRQILLDGRPLFHLAADGVLGVAVLRHEHQTGRIAVQTVDEADLPAFAIFPQPVCQRVGQRAALVVLRRMDDEERLFVHDEQVAVLVHDVQGDVLRLEVTAFFGESDGQGLTCPALVPQLCGAAVQGDLP